MNDHAENDHEKHAKFVEVSISTTAGFYPAEGFNKVPAHQHVKVELDLAKTALKINDVSEWVATVVTPQGKKPVDQSKSYLENGLSGKVEIDWGPKEGGGGASGGK